MIGTNDINGNINVVDRAHAARPAHRRDHRRRADRAGGRRVDHPDRERRHEPARSRTTTRPSRAWSTPAPPPGKHVVFVDNYAAFVKDTNLPDVAHGRRPAPERRGLRRPRAVVLRRDRTALAVRALIVPGSRVQGQPMRRSDHAGGAHRAPHRQVPGRIAGSLGIGLHDTETPPQLVAAGDQPPALAGAADVVARRARWCPVSLSMTVQSSRVVPGCFAIRPWMQGALTYSDDLVGDVGQRRREVVVADRQHAAVGAELAHELGDAHGRDRRSCRRPPCTSARSPARGKTPRRTTCRPCWGLPVHDVGRRAGR